MIDVAFIGHLDSVPAYRRALEALRGPDLDALSDVSVERVVRGMAPMPVCDFRVRGAPGVEGDARYIDAFLLVDESLALKAALAKVHRACAEAARSGARVAGLGGFTSIVGEQSGFDFGTVAPGARTVFTTGNGLTAAVIAAQVRAVASPGAVVAVVGAPGDVGSGVCRSLRDYALLAVGRNPRRLAAFADEEGVPALSWAEAAPRADVVVLVASAPAGGIALSGVRPDAIVLDAGHPPNAGGAHPRLAIAGRITHERGPVGGLGAFISHNCGPGEFHACMAEAEVLALADRPDLASSGRGRISADRAAILLDLAATCGVRPAEIRV